MGGRNGWVGRWVGMGLDLIDKDSGWVGRWVGMGLDLIDKDSGMSSGASSLRVPVLEATPFSALLTLTIAQLWPVGRHHSPYCATARPPQRPVLRPSRGSPNTQNARKRALLPAIQPQTALALLNLREFTSLCIRNITGLSIRN